nr:WD repeat-containing protein 48-like [Tanacetum cinerariifolium]
MPDYNANMDYDYDMDDGFSQPEAFDDSNEDDDDLWKPLNPHEQGNLKTYLLASVDQLKDNVGSVKLWKITRGVVIRNYGPVSFEMKEELFEMVSIPAWFSVDSKLGNLSAFGYPAMLSSTDVLSKCFSAEMYSADLKHLVCTLFVHVKDQQLGCNH